jgi:hypothetical protein
MTPQDALPALGRVLLIAGLLVAAIGLFLAFGGRLPFLGRLPGDLVFGRGNIRVYLPLTTSLLVSIVLTLILTLIAFLRR